MDQHAAVLLLVRGASADTLPITRCELAAVHEAQGRICAMGAQALCGRIRGEIVALNGIVGELGIRDAIEAVAALGVFLDVPGHEIRGVTGNLDELGVDQARARAAFVAGAVGDGETRSDGDGLGYNRVETAEQPIALPFSTPVTMIPSNVTFFRVIPTMLLIGLPMTLP